MKTYKKITSFILAVITLFCFCSCADDPSAERGGEEAGNQVVEEIKTTDQYLFRQGKSDYVLILPETYTSAESLAAEEFVAFMRQSTGYTFETYSDADTLPKGQKFISIGNTAQRNRTAIEIDDKKLGRSGFRVDTFRDNIYVSGANTTSSFGVLYGVYYLLENLIDYKCYAADEIYLVKKDTIKLFKYEVQYIPNIEMRSANYRLVTSDPTYQNRMRLVNRFNSTEWAVNGHSTLVVLPAKKYLTDHPDWYAGSGTELCFTNEDMIDEFIKNTKQYITDNPQAIYMSVTMMDDYDFCECDRCKASVEKYGGKVNGGETATYLIFVNKVARAIAEWMEEEYPSREMTIVAYAYHQTFQAPVKVEKGKYVAVAPEVIPEKNVSVMFCPISQDYLYPVYDSANLESARSYEQWNVLTNNVSIYEYTTNFLNYLVNFNNFGTVASNIKFYAQNHITYYFEQSSGGSFTPCFEALRIYTESQMLWDPSQDYADLTVDFFHHYYKDASVGMLNYYNLLRSWYKKLENDGVSCGGIYYTIQKEEHWPMGVLQSFLNCIDDAFASIEPLKESDPELYSVLWDRINLEKISPMYLMCALYGSYYPADEYKAMVDDLEYYGGKYGILLKTENGIKYSEAIQQLRQ